MKFQKRKLRETYREEIIDQPRHGEQGLQYIVPLLIEFELSDDEFRELFEYCRTRGITALCTPWDRSSVDFLETCDLAAYKIGSPDLTNFPLIEYVAQTGKPMLLSTGMSTEEEVRRTLAFLTQCGAEYALFHCVSTYPAAPEEINLRFMERLREWSGRPVGYSGHDTGTSISLAAVAMGARLLERHLTLDRTMRGPDHKASLEPAQFADQVRALREVELSLGVPHRWITRGETLNRRVLGKSLVAATDIPANTAIARGMLTSKSPGLGLSPQFVDKLVGRRLARDVSRDEMFRQSDIDDPVAGRRGDPDRRRRAVGHRRALPRLRGARAVVRAARHALRRVPCERSRSRRWRHGLSSAARSRSGSSSMLRSTAHDTLIDLCAADDAQRQLSVQRIQKTIDLARRSPRSSPGIPRSSTAARKSSCTSAACRRGPEATTSRLPATACSGRSGSSIPTASTCCSKTCRRIPWYFGGRWFGHVLCDSENTVRLCRESGLGLCFDTSHAALAVRASGASLLEFAKAVAPYVRHLHLSDGAGTSGEGLQIGDGSVNFVALLPVLLESQPTVIPEIWMGHHENGAGIPRRARAAHRDPLGEPRPAAAERSPPPSRPARAHGHGRRDRCSPRCGSSTPTAWASPSFSTAAAGSSGVVTDGDIRHAFVRGINLHDDVSQAMTASSAFHSGALLSGRYSSMSSFAASGCGKRRARSSALHCAMSRASRSLRATDASAAFSASGGALR